MIPAKTCVQRTSRLSHSLSVGSRIIEGLASAIGRIAVRTNQQRHVIMLRRIFNVEDYAHLRIEAATTERREIRFGIEAQAIGSFCHGTIDEKNGFTRPSVSVQAWLSSV